MGKGPIEIKSKSYNIIELDLAYYFERNNLFHKAVENYKIVLQKRIRDRALAASILLHKGYCLAVLGDIGNARKNFLEIIENYSSESVAITATILMRYIEGFHNEHLRIVDSEREVLTLTRLLSPVSTVKAGQPLPVVKGLGIPPVSA